jgi:MFS family permease
MRFVLAVGIVNLFGDMTYEGGASINGPYLGMLGASAASISIIAGLGEFLGYSLRSVSGYIADRTGRYWLISFIGYAINLLAVPAMALAGSWQLAAIFILAERIGRAIRKPTMEAMLSYSTARHGRGWVYGVNTALDETGATLGPLLVAGILFFKGSYQIAYAFLLLSSLLALATLTFARLQFPVPARLEEGRTATERKIGRRYWLLMAASSCFGAGMVSYELVSYYLIDAGLVPATWMPVMLAFATGSGVLASLALGRLYDRFGMPVTLVAITMAAAFTPLVFAGPLAAALIAMPLFGVAYAVQDTLLKALIAEVLPEGRRGLAFGLFYAGYGAAWLVGSTVMGLLFEKSRPGLIAFAVAAQLLSIPLFLLARKRHASR